MQRILFLSEQPMGLFNIYRKVEDEIFAIFHISEFSLVVSFVYRISLKAKID